VVTGERRKKEPRERQKSPVYDSLSPEEEGSPEKGEKNEEGQAWRNGIGTPRWVIRGGGERYGGD